MKILRYIFSFLFCAVPAFCSSQVSDFDTLYVRSSVNELCRNAYHGRGFVKDGDIKASKYILKQFKKSDLKFFNRMPYQDFSFNVNTFPASMELSFCESKLKPGVDYIVHPASASLTGEFQIMEPNSTNNGDGFYVFKNESVKDLDKRKLIDSLIVENDKLDGIVFTGVEKLTWSVSLTQLKIPVIYLKSGVFDPKCKTLKIDIDADFRPHLTRNVIGYIEGSLYPDSFIVLTGHYDHLGMMGAKTQFTGANDNASGIAMMLGLAKFYALEENRPEYSLAFMAFAGEEAGLIGSEFYVNNPLFPLPNIKFLINMDLMGAGEEGIMVVNGTEYPGKMSLLRSINKDKELFVEIGERGKAANSDHYYFSENDVPSFFIYTMGPRKSYHDVYDIPQTLEFPKMESTFQLISSFIKSIGD